jgi:NAD(P)-dependent dehydrogenase (short-subunit alcohol dehydrogenase family)
VLVTSHAGLKDRRVLVVGASSGIGRALALRAGEAGATVALAARRLALVEEVAGQINDAGGRARAWRCDVTDEGDCGRLVDEAAEWMGGIDVVMYLSGSSPLVRVEDATASLWQRMFSTNVVGAALVVSRALDNLRAAQRPAVVVTHHSMGNPWPWLGVYGTTKAALAELARALRAEEPRLRVLCVAVGNTATSFADEWDPAVAAEAFEVWNAGGMLRYEVLQPEQMAQSMLDALLDPEGADEVLIAGAEVSRAAG